MRTTKDFTKLHPPTLQGYYENRARVTINGKRMRLGNPKHPFNKTYLKEGMWRAFEKMGLTPSNGGYPPDLVPNRCRDSSRFRDPPRPRLTRRFRFQFQLLHLQCHIP